MHKLSIAKHLRTIGCAVLVAAVVIVLLAGLSVLVIPKDNQKAFGIINESPYGVLGEPKDTLDVLFIGDSEAYSSFSPLQMWEEHGFCSYVCATSSQQLPYGYSLLRMATENQHPKVVVIETNCLYAASSLDDATMRMLQDVLPVFEYHNRWKTLGVNDLSMDIEATHSDEFKGFYVNKDVVAADASEHMAPSDEVAQMPKLNKIFLHLIIEHCRAIGATPVLVSTPSTFCWNMPRHNAITQLAQQAKIDYVDLNMGDSKVEIDWANDTRDKGDHMNFFGATKVSKAMGEYLSNAYDLPDHRDDNAFSSWNDSLSRYKQL